MHGSWWVEGGTLLAVFLPQEHCKFLQSLHELLQSATSPSHLGRRPSPTSSWAKLCPAVNTTAASLVEALRSTKHEVGSISTRWDVC